MPTDTTDSSALCDANKRAYTNIKREINRLRILRVLVERYINNKPLDGRYVFLFLLNQVEKI